MRGFSVLEVCLKGINLTYVFSSLDIFGGTLVRFDDLVTENKIRMEFNANTINPLS